MRVSICEAFSMPRETHLILSLSIILSLSKDDVSARIGALSANVYSVRRDFSAAIRVPSSR